VVDGPWVKTVPFGEMILFHKAWVTALETLKARFWLGKH
jgi:hypothetical protein